MVLFTSTLFVSQKINIQFWPCMEMEIDSNLQVLGYPLCINFTSKITIFWLFQCLDMVKVLEIRVLLGHMERKY